MYNPKLGIMARTGIIDVDLSDEQLAAIGLIAISFNEAESLVDDVFIGIMALPPDKTLEVTSRIAIDGKIEAIKSCVKKLRIPAVFFELITRTWLGFSEVKIRRNQIVHCRVHNASANIGRTNGKRGNVTRVMLSLETLNGVVARLDTIIQEMRELVNIMARLLQLQGNEVDAIDEQILPLLHNYQQYQKKRQSLEPLPDFPSDDEMLVALAKWYEIRNGQLSGWLQQWPEVFPTPRQPALDGGYTAPPWPVPEDVKKEENT